MSTVELKILHKFGVWATVGSKIEKFLDSCSHSDYEPSKISYPEKNPYAHTPYIEDPKIWIKSLYALILHHEIKEDDEGLDHWLKKIEEGTPRQSIESYFRDVAMKDNEKHKSFRIEELFSGSSPEDRIFVSINSSLDNIFLSTKIISAIKEKYPNKKIFVSSNETCQSVFSGNTMIESAIIQTKEFEDPDFLNKNFFQSYCLDNFSIKNHHSILVQ